MTLTAYKNQRPTLGKDVYIADSAQIIGDVTLESDVSVWPGAVIRGDVQRIIVGSASNIQDGAILHVTQRSNFNPDGFPLQIGSGVTIGHRAVLHGCTIGDLCLVGIGAIIMDGVEIGDCVMVAAGALVPPGKKLESGYLYVGAPARQARPLTDAEKTFLQHSRDSYIRLKNDYLMAL